VTAEARTVQRGSYSTGRVLDGDGRLLAECRERGRQIHDVPDLDSAALAPAAGDPADGGLAELLGLELDDEPHLRVLPALENPRRMLHGGISLAACEVVATWTRVRAGCSLPTSSLHVVHTRAAPYGSTVELTAKTVHAGRSLWVTDVTGAVAGRTVVTARISAQ
jgi:acyl-coenzyme A thioesterase PaaI-like protein